MKAAPALAKTFLGSLACVVISAAAAFADPFSVLRYHQHQQEVISCLANFECNIELESGERINNGYNAWTHDWDPHVGYTGDRNATPHLILKPYQTNLRTNIILTTTRRTYYFLQLVADSPGGRLQEAAPATMAGLFFLTKCDF